MDDDRHQRALQALFQQPQPQTNPHQEALQSWLVPKPSLPRWKQIAQGVLESGVDTVMSALGMPINDSRASQWGELLSAGLPMIGGLKTVAAGRKVANPIKAYHGSPHDFDQFSLSKIGTGEGAQAQGRGLYFSERPDVAKTYKEKLAGDSGRMYEVDIHAEPDDFLDWDAPLSQQPKMAPILDYLRSKPIPNQKFAAKVESGELTGREAHLVLSGELSLDEARKTYPKTPRRPDEVSSDFMRDQGLAGIKYKDAGSRTAIGQFVGKGSEGADITRNYVVMNDKLISIVKKYGISGAVGAGLINQQQAQQLKEQGY